MMKMLFIALLLIIMPMSCHEDKENDTFEDCLNVVEKEDCIINFFSTNGKFYNKENGKRWERLKISDDKNMDKLCKELFDYRNYKKKDITLALFTIARINKAPCLCDYIEYRINQKDIESADFEEWHNELCTQKE